MSKNLTVVYMMNGLNLVGETVSKKPLMLKGVIGLMPNQQGGMGSIDIFPFSNFNEAMEIKDGTYISCSDVDDPQLEKVYEDSIKQIRAQRAGIELA